ncbi:MAG: PKD domain-containing protein [Flavobacteriales bacterium]|nr:PKD domain-containing protein [Flavobacteriales bacterium]
MQKMWSCHGCRSTIRSTAGLGSLLLCLGLFIGVSGAKAQCADGYCPMSIGYSEIGIGMFEFYIPGSACTELNVLWSFGNGYSMIDGTSVVYAYLFSGSYEVTATFDDSDCQGAGEVVLSVFVNVQVQDCSQIMAQITQESCNTISGFVGWPGMTPFAEATWNFGDGTVVSDVNIFHTYTTPGTYMVTVAGNCNTEPFFFNLGSVTVDNTCDGICPDFISWDPIPLGEGYGFHFDLQVCQPGTIVQWNFGDGVIENGSCSIDHAYTSTGTYTITATFYDEDCSGGQGALSVTIIIEIGVECDPFNVVLNYLDGNTISFEPGPWITCDEVENPPIWTISEYFGSPIYYNTEDCMITVDFENPGTYAYSFYIPGTEYCSDGFFEVTGDGFCPDEILITDLGDGNYEFSVPGLSEDTPVNWQFGDGSTQNFAYGSVTHAYEESGSYGVTANFYDGDCGDTWTILNGDLFVQPECPSEISYIEIACHEFGFFVDELYTDATYEWNFGDGSVQDWNDLVVHTFDQSGTYEVCLNITSGQCAGTQICTMIEVEYCDEGTDECPGAYWNVSSCGEIFLELNPWNPDVPVSFITPDTAIVLDGPILYYSLPTDAPSYDGYYVEAEGCLIEIPIDPLPTYCSCFEGFEMDGTCSPITITLDVPEGSELHWVTGGYNFYGTDTETLEFTEMGLHEVCVHYQNENCDMSDYYCFNILVEPCPVICPDSIVVTQLSDATYAFFIEGIDNGETVVWNFGDGNEITDDESVTYTFEPGTYMVTATFMDADCPWDGPTILNTEDTKNICPSDLVIEVISCQSVFYAVPELESGTYMQYTFDGEYTLNQFSSFGSNYLDEGIHEICATNDSLMNLGCPAVCNTVILEDCPDPCAYPVDVFSLCNLHEYAFFELGVDSIAVYLDGQFETFSTADEELQTCNNVTIVIFSEGIHEVCFESFDANGNAGCTFCIYVEYVDCDDDCGFEIEMVDQSCDSATFQILNPPLEDFVYYITLNDTLLVPLNNIFTDTSVIMSIPILPGSNTICFEGATNDFQCFSTWCTEVEGCETDCPDSLALFILLDIGCFISVVGLPDGTELELTVNGEFQGTFAQPVPLPDMGTEELEVCVTNEALEAEGCPALCTTVDGLECGTGIRDIAASSFTLFPNPTSEHVTVTLAGNLKNLEVTIFDSTGRIMRRQTIYSLTTDLDVSQFAAGLYFLQLSGDGVRETKQVEIFR